MNDSDLNARATEVFSELLDQALARGEQVDVSQACAEHPELAELLRAREREYQLATAAWEKLNKMGDELAQWAEIRHDGCIGEFEILGDLGRGGMAQVFVARRKGQTERRALKVLSPLLAEDDKFVKRFQREANVAARLRHDNVVRVYSVGKVGPYHYIEMELVEGETLARRLEREGKLAPEEATRIVMAAARGLAAAHAEGLIHRDIKPGNVMLASNGDIKIMDFGLAKDLETDTGGLTDPNQILGTPDYLSPEQARGEECDARSDLYSLGALYFHALTGRPPYADCSPMEAVLKHAREPAPDPRSFEPGLPDSYCAIVLKAMAKNQRTRYQNCDEMIQDMEAALSGAPLIFAAEADSEAEADGSTPPFWESLDEDRPRRARWPWAAAALVLAAAAGVWLLRPGARPGADAPGSRPPAPRQPLPPVGSAAEVKAALTAGVAVIGGALANVVTPRSDHIYPVVCAGPGAYVSDLKWGRGRIAVAAAGGVGKGRVAALGEDLWLTSLADQYDNSRFARNCFEWLTAGRGGLVGFYTPVGALATRRTLAPQIKEPLLREGFQFEDLSSLPDADALDAYSVIVVTRPHERAFTPDEVDELARYVRRGGGLLIAAMGWFWAKSHAGESIESFPANVLGRRVGVEFPACGVYRMVSGACLPYSQFRTAP